DEFLTPATAEKYKLPMLLPPIRWEWYVILTLVLVIIIFLESAYRAIKQREIKLATISDEYTHSLMLVQVDQEDRRQLDPRSKRKKELSEGKCVSFCDCAIA